MNATMIIAPMIDDDVDAVVELWNACGLTRPWNNPAQDIAFARQKPESDVLVGRLDGEIVASVMVGHDGHRGVAYYVAVSPNTQAKGLGRLIMSAAENWLTDRGVWKMNLLIREGNEKVQSFYETLGYQEEPRTCMAKKLKRGST